MSILERARILDEATIPDIINVTDNCTALDTVSGMDSSKWRGRGQRSSAYDFDRRGGTPKELKGIFY